jgi:hypothetical protein
MLTNDNVNINAHKRQCLYQYSQRTMSTLSTNAPKRQCPYQCSQPTMPMPMLTTDNAKTNAHHKAMSRLMLTTHNFNIIAHKGQCHYLMLTNDNDNTDTLFLHRLNITWVNRLTLIPNNVYNVHFYEVINTKGLQIRLTS